MQGGLDGKVRDAAISHLANLQETYQDNIPRRELQKGFVFEGARVPLVGPQGIVKLKVLRDIPLSITTVPVVEGRLRPPRGRVDRRRERDPHKA